ncbi:MAG TPA: hypothetical protein H9825_10330 [Candidatus Sphingobacterium stercorigallinarum]|nr:hypothetical protein [Candidatus Sphingobacterium stercorigallinarum]
MHHVFFTYRRVVASFLLFWIWGIIVSGVVFMHKEVTSTGEIVTHIHPYNLAEEHHHEHQSDEEIRFLDIVFQGSYVTWSPISFELPVRAEFQYNRYGDPTFCLPHSTGTPPASRGPPQFS